MFKLSMTFVAAEQVVIAHRTLIRHFVIKAEGFGELDAGCRNATGEAN